MSGPTLSVIVPAFNEEGNLAQCVADVRAKLGALGVEHEILVVDDGSSDRTCARAQELGVQQVLRHERNRGMGAAVRTGLGAARGTWIIVLPGDNQFDVDFAQMMDRSQEADVVVGTRDRGYTTLSRRVPSWLYTEGMRLLFGLRVRGEVNLYRRAMLEGIHVAANGFFGNTELLIRSVRRGARVASCSIRLRERVAGRATGRDPRRIAQVLFETLKLRVRLSLEGG